MNPQRWQPQYPYRHWFDLALLIMLTPTRLRQNPVLIRMAAAVLAVALLLFMAPVSAANLALGKPASQSSTGFGGSPSRAVDGNTSGIYGNNSVTHTNNNLKAWWQVDLGAAASLSSIKIHNRTDCCGTRLNNADILVSSSPFPNRALNAAEITAARVGTIGTALPINTLTLSSVSGRYVRVQLQGTNFLSLAEVEVFDTPPVSAVNLALAKPASQSSTGFGGSPGRAVDGNTSGIYGNNSVTHTNNNLKAWWQVDLGAAYSLTSIKIYNRTDCCGTRLNNADILVSSSPFPNRALNAAEITAARQGTIGTALTLNTFTLSNVAGRYVRVQLQGTNFLSLAEVEVFGGALLAARYDFDENSWNGTAGEVVDSTGNGNSGRAINGATPVPGKLCNAGSFNGTTQSLLLPDTPNLNFGPGAGFTIATWVKTTTPNGAIVSLRNTRDAGQVVINLQLGFNGISGPGGGQFIPILRDNNGTISAFSSGPVVNDGNWHFVAITYDGSSTFTSYVDGVLAGTKAYVANGGFTSFGVRTVGKEGFWDTINFAPGRTYIAGLIDELKIFNGALTGAQISTGYNNENAGKNWDGTPRVCSSTTLHHIEILHSTGTGITCAANTLTIKACADAASPCTAYTGGVSGTLTSTGTPTANWDGTSGGATGAGFVIASGASSVTKNVQVTPAGTVSFGTTSLSPTASNATICNFGSPSCTFTTSVAGFLFSDTATGNTFTIPKQEAGTATAANAIFLRAVQTSTTNAAVCTPAIISQNSVGVTMGYSCNNPSSCQAGSLLTVNATAVPSAGSSVLMNFDANGASPITLKYADVGMITVNASKSITPSGGTAVSLAGSSNPFVVKPGGFTVTAIRQTAAPQLVNPAAASSAGAKFLNAGAAFTATVTATTSAGVATPNFGKEIIAQNVLITPTLVQPIPGTLGTLNGSTISGGSFSGGVATVTNLSYEEVGIITLTPSVAGSDYLGAGFVTGTTTGNVGRFIPDHFAITQGTVVPACVSGSFTYFGQDGLTTPFTLTAQTVANATTQNYTGSFAKLPLTAWGAAPASTGAPGFGFSAGTLPAGLVLSASAVTQPEGSWGAGVANVTAKHMINRLTAPTGITSVTISATPVDSDGVTMAVTAVTAASDFYYGRMIVDNAYGSQLLPLSVNVFAQYWDAISQPMNPRYVINTKDNCTQPSSLTNFTVTPDIKNAVLTSNISDSNIIVNIIALKNGRGTIKINPPTPAITQRVRFKLVSKIGWLPGFGTEALGVNKNGPVIYIREIY